MEKLACCLSWWITYELVASTKVHVNEKIMRKIARKIGDGVPGLKKSKKDVQFFEKQVFELWSYLPEEDGVENIIIFQEKWLLKPDRCFKHPVISTINYL